MIDLSFFCGEDEEVALPFSEGIYTYATDGYIIVRVPHREGADGKMPPGGIGFSFEPMHAGGWQEIPDLPAAQTKKCPTCRGIGKVNPCVDCDGEGEVYFSKGRHAYEFECQECYGDGVVPGKRETCRFCKGVGKMLADSLACTVISGTKLTLELLRKIKTLPDANIYLPPSPGGLVSFRFDGGVGLLAARNQD